MKVRMGKQGCHRSIGSLCWGRQSVPNHHGLGAAGVCSQALHHDWQLPQHLHDSSDVNSHQHSRPDTTKEQPAKYMHMRRQA